MKRIDTVFKTICKAFISKTDRLHFSKIFAPYDAYTIDQLEIITSQEKNVELVKKARLTIIEFIYSDYLFDKDSTYPKESIVSFIEETLDKEKRPKEIIKTKLYYLLFVAFIIAFYDEKPSYDEDLSIIDKTIKETGGKYHFYRGQHNYDWRLSPSILRGFDKSVVLDDNTYYALLMSDESEIKFNALIRTEETNTYDKYAFMQHARSFSPFIDFTKNISIATSFALSNVSSVNDFRNNDAAVITIDLLSPSSIINNKKGAKEFLKKEFKLTLIDSEYFIFNHDYLIEKSNGDVERLKIVSITDLIKAITPKFKVFDIATNDRMKYQKGVFLCFYDCLCLKSYVCYELNKLIYTRKARLKYKYKREMLKALYEQRRYDPEHLMDPYLLFKE